MNDIEELEYLKRCYEEKSEECFKLERRYLTMKHEKEQAENYIDKLLLFIQNLKLSSDIQIPPWR